MQNNPGLRQAGSTIEQQALQALMSGSDLPPMPNYPGTGMLPPPNMTGSYRRPGRGETAASIMGMIGSGLGAYYGGRA